MAGTLELSKDLCWMPAGWIYDNALEGIANAVGSERPDLGQALLQSLTDVNGGHLDLQSSPVDDLKAMQNGLSHFTNVTMDAGPDALHNPDFFDGYVEQLRQFEKLLAERLGELEPLNPPPA
jgi:hypothetical protein